MGLLTSKCSAGRRYRRSAPAQLGWNRLLQFGSVGFTLERNLKIAAAFCVTLLALPPLAAQSTQRSGAEIYRDYCASCHAGGLQGAPVANDADEWQPRLAKGYETLLQNAKQGLNGMPPMGVCVDCSEAELRAAVDEMLRF
jgi:cytochrome c5